MIDLGVFDTFQIPYSCLAPEHHDLIAQGGLEAEVQRPALNDVWTHARLDEVLPAGMSRAELILRFTLSHPHCHTTIVGTCNPAHLEENLAAAAAGPLSPELYDEVRRRAANLRD